MEVQAGICLIASAIWYMAMWDSKAYGILFAIGSVFAFLFLPWWIAMLAILALMTALAAIYTTFEMKEIKKRRGIKIEDFL